VLRCPNCSRENPDDARFCSECATPLAEVEQREERKTVTVVFADLVGSTARAERLDPEDVRAILAPYHARLRQELERFGGSVEKFIGDAVVGVFGAPTTHEDDPERGVRAALAIQDAIAELNEADPGLELEVRVGVNTGEALVALGARPEQGEGMVSGDVMNTGARLQSAAPPGGVLVGDATYRATERVIDYREAAPIEAKGKSAPLSAWVAVAPRASFGIDLSETGGARLVGRDRELDLLAGALSRVRETRDPQLVTLVGVPGIGKSRLVRELFRIVEKEEDLIYWRQGRSLPYGEGVAYWALGEMVKAQSGILESDEREVAAAKLDRAVESLELDGDQVAWLGRHLRPLVGLVSSDGASAERSEMFAAWRRLIEAMAEERPAVFVFEDLQWADDGMLDFVDELVDWIPGVPLLVVASARPELLERRPGWGGGKRNALTISLSALSDEDTARLFADLLERAVLPAENQRALLAHAGGNPLFAEEYARMLSAGESAPAGVPESLQALVAARVDGLPAGEKTLLQAGSVFGKVFWTDAVGAIVGESQLHLAQALRPLERKEFVRRERRSAVAGGEQYTFVHALVRDVVYGQLSRPDRSRWHRRAAGWIASLPPDRSEDRAEMLAYHLTRTVEYDRAAGREADPELVRRAARASHEAGDRAWALGAYAAAARHYGAALAAAGEDAALLLAYGRALSLGGQAAGSDELERSAVAFLAADDRSGAAEAESELALYYRRRGSGDTATEHVRRALDLIEGVPPSRARAAVLALIARLLILLGQVEDGLVMAEEAARIAAELGFDETRAGALNSVALAKSILQDDGGIPAMEESLAFALQASPSEAARAYINLGSTVVSAGADARRGRDIHRDGLLYAERFGFDWHTQWLRSELSIDAYRLGDWHEALELAERVIADAERVPHYMAGAAFYVRAVIAAARGERDAALADIRRSLEIARETKEPQALEPTLASAAYVASQLGAVDEARALLSELEQTIVERDGPVYEPWYALELALALRASAADRELFEIARRHAGASLWFVAAAAYLDGDFDRSADLMDEIGALVHAAAARVAAAEAHLTAGRRAEADAQLGAAVAFYRDAGASKLLADAERLLPAAS
jgi:class 3 adenylate cyclase/tetratricopeptide (TPR) repeat protein